MLYADQEYVFLYRAKEFLEGDYAGWTPTGYMYRFPFQNTIVLFFSVFHFIFGEYALLAVRLFNAACWYIGILGIYKLTERYFGRRTAVCTYVALLFFLPMFTYVIFIYGTVPGICLSIWGIYQEKRFEETGKTRYLAGTGILLLLAIMWKTNNLVVMIAVIIMLAMHAIREKEIKPLLGIAWILAMYLIGTQGALAWIRAVTGQNTGNGIPFIGWVVEGLNESWVAPGWFNAYKDRLYENYHGDLSIVKPMMVQELKNSLKVFAEQPEYALRFFSRKTTSMWSSPFLEATTIITQACPRTSLKGIFENILYDGQILNVILLLMLDIIQSILYFGVLLFLIFGRKNRDLKKAAFIICFLGGFLFHCFWEAKCQYILIYYLMLFPYGIEGFRAVLDYFANMCRQWMDQEKRSKKDCLAILWKDNGMKLLAAVFVLVIVIGLLPDSIASSTFKLGIDTAEYIWFCKNNG